MTQEKNFKILKSSKEYKEIYKHGKSAYFGGIVIYYSFVDRDSAAGFGFAISKKMVNAVKRNRIKRLIKESLRTTDLNTLIRMHAIIAVRKDLSTSTFADICNSINMLIDKVKKDIEENL
ncbi:MAG: ribonuclease P protein component [Actinobacteria bacterium]|nr:ribonuclease P protein component [Actinomycetota bacterium]